MQSKEMELSGKVMFANSIFTPLFRNILPFVVIVGVLPQLYSMWFGWKILSIFLPKWLYQKGDDMVLSMYQRVMVFFFEHWVNTKVKFYGDAEAVFKKRERVLCISNHQSSVDWITVSMIGLRQGSEGNMRFMIKDQLRYLPLYGMYLYQHSCIFVRRGNFNQNKMIRCLDYLKNKDIPSWIVIFPEGTRHDPQSTTLLEKNREYAKSQGLSPLTHCSMPKSRGCYLSLEKLRDNLDGVYNVTILYEDSNKNGKRMRAPSMTEFLRLNSPVIHIHIRRIPISEVPSSELEVKSWLNDEFVLKDKVLAQLCNAENADRSSTPIGEPILKPLSLASTLPCMLAVTAVSVLAFTHPLFTPWYWKFILAHSVGGYFWFAIRPAT